jgi:hypothetical protein
MLWMVFHAAGLSLYWIIFRLCSCFFFIENRVSCEPILYNIYGHWFILLKYSYFCFCFIFIESFVAFFLDDFKCHWFILLNYFWFLSSFLFYWNHVSGDGFPIWWFLNDIYLSYWIIYGFVLVSFLLNCVSCDEFVLIVFYVVDLPYWINSWCHVMDLF